MSAHEQSGVTLIEAVVAMFLLGLIVSGLVPGFLAFTDVNTLNEVRTGAVQAAQTEMEALRSIDLTLVPTTAGVWSTTNSTVGNRTYQVVVRNCVATALCTDDARHFLIEVNFDGTLFYTVESVFTTLL